MAFGKVNISNEGGEFKRYIGVASVYVRDVNPSKSDLEKFYGREMENTPEYVSEADVDGKKVPQVRIDFMIQADPEKYEGVDLKSRISFFLRRMPRVSKSGTQQIIDKYGRTAWATPEEIKAHQVPTYSNGKLANISPDYRVAYDGEEGLIEFLKTYLGIAPCMKYVDGNWVMLSEHELPDCEASLEHIEDYFKGNFKELKDAINMAKEFRVKVLFGIRTNDEGKQFQTVYNRMVVKNSVKTYSKLDANVADAKAAGAYKDTEFEVSELHEYTVAPTDLSTPADSTIPGVASTPWD